MVGMPAALTLARCLCLQLRPLLLVMVVPQVLCYAIYDVFAGAAAAAVVAAAAADAADAALMMFSSTSAV